MRITAIETIIHPDHPSLLWVRVHTDSELVGLGETVGQPGATARIVHDMLAGLVVGSDPSRIEELWTRCYRAINYYGVGGAEMRALSAIDIALWDLLGKLVGQPTYVLLGGASRDAIPVYQTCGDYGPIRDRERFLSEPSALAKELVAAGTRAVKIWPFDELAIPYQGQFVPWEAVESGLDKVRAMREAAGPGFEIAIEGHSLWNLPMAIRIAKSLEPLRPLWIEDFVWPENAEVLRRLSAATTIPVIASERLLTRFGLRQAIETSSMQVIMFDMAWSGGFTEARKIASAAGTYLLPIAPHNAGGPIGHAATTHLCAHVPNLLLMETIRAFYLGFYRELAEGVVVPVSGFIPLPEAPGLGVDLRPDVLAREDLVREVTSNPNRDAQGLGSADPWSTARF